jgi:hypothetical protein
MSGFPALIFAAALAASGAAGSKNVRRNNGPDWSPPTREEIKEMLDGGSSLEEIQDMYFEYATMPPSSERRVAILLYVEDGRILLVQDEAGVVKMQEFLK